MVFKLSDVAEEWYMKKQRMGCFSSTHRPEKDTVFYKVGLKQCMSLLHEGTIYKTTVLVPSKFFPIHTQELVSLR